MDIDKISLTNLKIKVSNTCLIQLEEAEKIEGQSISVKIACLQNSYFSLYLSYLAFLSEVSNHYQVNDVTSFNELKQCLIQKDVFCQYTELLADLENDVQSWLGWLIFSYKQCLTFKLPISERVNEEIDGANNIIASTNSKKMTEQEMLFNCLDSLQSNVKQFRELMEEW